jgi:predicted pore-forming effector associated with SMODS systems
MPNSIPDEQNTQRQLDRLAAQRYLYSRAKTLLAVQMILTLPTPIIWAVATALWPDSKVYAVFWGVTVSILDVLVLDRIQRSLVRQAAGIQELFDCDVLHLDWRRVKAGHRPDYEAILDASEKYKRKAAGSPPLLNWYPMVVGQLPLELARIVCQRVNCWWDAKLKRRYASWMIAILTMLTITVFAISLIGGMTLQKFLLTVVAPLAPAYIFGVRESLRHLESARTSDRLKEHTQDLWARALDKIVSREDVTHESRELQAEIYDRRRTGTLIFDWIYKRLRRGYEEQMNKGAEELVEEALRKGW